MSRRYVLNLTTCCNLRVAYMGVTNLEGDQNDSHVRHIAEFAIDMVNEATRIEIDADDPSRGNINIRYV